MIRRVTALTLRLHPRVVSAAAASSAQPTKGISQLTQRYQAHFYHKTLVLHQYILCCCWFPFFCSSIILISFLILIFFNVSYFFLHYVSLFPLQFQLELRFISLTIFFSNKICSQGTIFIVFAQFCGTLCLWRSVGYDNV